MYPQWVQPVRRQTIRCGLLKPASWRGSHVVAAMAGFRCRLDTRRPESHSSKNVIYDILHVEGDYMHHEVVARIRLKNCVEKGGDFNVRRSRLLSEPIELFDPACFCFALLVSPAFFGACLSTAFDCPSKGKG
ncbi:hypothetical protein Tco_1458514 [Tanacetum coccineum]